MEGGGPSAAVQSLVGARRTRDWRDEDRAYHVVWVKETGELYAVRLGDPTVATRRSYLLEAAGAPLGSVEVLGGDRLDPARAQVIWLARGSPVNDVVLAGWEKSRELNWVRERIAHADHVLARRLLTHFAADDDTDAQAALDLIDDAIARAGLPPPS